MTPHEDLTGRTALVTGASSGIGREFARQLASLGAHLVLTARSMERLAPLAEQLHADHGVRVDVLAADLAATHAVDGLVTDVTALCVDVDVLVNNAGFATQGAFAAIDPEQDRDLVAVNVAAVVDLCHAFVPGMVERGFGRVVNVASMGGFQPAPYLATYGASKAFVLAFTEALAAERAHPDLRFLALCPGPVETGFFDRLGSREAAIGQVLDVGAVVEAALAGLAAGEVVVVPGWRNRATSIVTRILPRRMVRQAAARATRSIGRP